MKALVDDMFLFLFKSKYRRKRTTAVDLVVLQLLLTFVSAAMASVGTAPDRCADVECGNGVCQNGTCVCHDGWQGPQCQYCGGKVK